MPDWYLIQTVHDTFLCLEKESGRICHCSNIEDPAHVPLLFAQASPTGAKGFLVSSQTDRGMKFLDDAPLLEMANAARSEIREANPDESEFILYPVLLHRSSTAKSAAFQDPFRKFFLCAEPAAADRPLGRVGFNREQAAEWEHFTLHPFRLKLAQRLRAMLIDASRVLSGTMSVADCAAIIVAAETSSERDTWLSICFRAFDFADFVHLLTVLRNGRAGDLAHGALPGMLTECPGFARNPPPPPFTRQESGFLDRTGAARIDRLGWHPLARRLPAVPRYHAVGQSNEPHRRR